MTVSKWRITVLGSLMADSTTRCNDLKRKTNGISNIMLAKTLRKMEEGGPVKRTEYPEAPIRMEYGITEKAGALRPILKQLAQRTVSLS